jgi:hypothetical protein
LFISLPPRNCGGNVGVLAPFASAAQQDNQRAVLASVRHAITRPEIQPDFKNSILKRFGCAEIARFKPANLRVHAVGGDIIQIIKPLPKGERPFSVYSRISKDPFTGYHLCYPCQPVKCPH